MSHDFELSGNLFPEKSRSKLTGYYAHKFRFRGKTKQVRLAKTEQESRKILIQRILEKISEILEKEGQKEDWHGNTPKEHVADYIASLKAKDVSPDYVAHVEHRLLTLIDECDIKDLARVKASKIEVYLAEQREAGKHAQTTSMHYRTSIKGLMTWMLDEERINKDALRKMKKKPRGDIKVAFRRRAIDEQGFNKLIKTTRKSKRTKFNLSPEDRATIYIVTNQTGLRASEVASLTPASFDFEEQTITVDCTVSKRRRYDVLPMSDGFAIMMKEYTADKPEDGRLWPGSWNKNAAAMLKLDLAEANIPYETREGRLDFHALGRHSFCTHVGTMDGVSAVLAQRVCRFSTPALLDRYVHVVDEQKRAVVDNLPKVA